MTLLKYLLFAGIVVGALYLIMSYCKSKNAEVNVNLNSEKKEFMTGIVRPRAKPEDMNEYLNNKVPPGMKGKFLPNIIGGEDGKGITLVNGAGSNDTLTGLRNFAFEDGNNKTSSTDLERVNASQTANAGFTMLSQTKKLDCNQKIVSDETLKKSAAINAAQAAFDAFRPCGINHSRSAGEMITGSTSMSGVKKSGSVLPSNDPNLVQASDSNFNNPPPPSAVESVVQERVENVAAVEAATEAVEDVAAGSQENFEAIYEPRPTVVIDTIRKQLEEKSNSKYSIKRLYDDMKEYSSIEFENNEDTKNMIRNVLQYTYELPPLSEGDLNKLVKELVIMKHIFAYLTTPSSKNEHGVNMGGLGFDLNNVSTENILDIDFTEVDAYLTKKGFNVDTNEFWLMNKILSTLIESVNQNTTVSNN